MENLYSVNAKLDRGYDKEFEEIKKRLKAMEQAVYGKSGPELRFD